MTREQFSSDSKVRASLPPGARSWNPSLLEIWLEARNQREAPTGRMQPGEGVERRIDGIKYRFARAGSVEQLELASDLVMRRYAWRGYDAEGALGAGGARGEVTYLAHCGARVDGTLTVRIDGQSELLAEHLYPAEIAGLRRKGARLCEFGRLAFDEGINTLEILGPLFHLGMSFARSRHACTHMVIEVNPRHVGFYQRVFGFKVLGEERTCDRVSAPAVLLHLSLEQASSHAEAQGGKRTGRRSIYPYCLGRNELVTSHRSLRSADMGSYEDEPGGAYAVC
jgi:N-acyl amino acid synthase FeeM